MSLAASFEIEYLQYLKPDGTLSGPLPPAVADPDSGEADGDAEPLFSLEQAATGRANSARARIGRRFMAASHRNARAAPSPAGFARPGRPSDDPR